MTSSSDSGSWASRDHAVGVLAQRLGPSRLLVDPADCTAYRHDESEVEGDLPDAVILAQDASAIEETLRVARDTGIPVTPRAAGTGKVGGCVPTAAGWVLDISSMNRIKDIDTAEGIAVVEPGVKLVDLQNAVQDAGWFYPPDPNSLEDCAIGGNVATNAAGPRAFKYGPTRDYVVGLDVYLIGGERLSLGHRTRKGVTGYDVTSLVVGSEGTLAVVSEITLKLLPLPRETLAMLAFFSGLFGAATAVARVTASGVLPRCIELFDATTLSAMREAGNSLNESAHAMLLIELDGEPEQCLTQAERVADACNGAGSIEVVVAQSASQRDRVWAARRTMSPAIRKLSKHKASEDIVVGSRSIPELCARVERTAAEQKIRWLVYGHAGDGNLHVNFLWDDPADKVKIDAAVAQLFRDTIELGGTLTGEHGVGILKAPYLELEQSSALIDLQRRLKQVFDPQGILNPGKIFPRLSHGNC
jgi:glycolate oxidase